MIENPDDTLVRRRATSVVIDDRTESAEHYSNLMMKATVHGKSTDLIHTLLKFALRRLGKFNPEHHQKPEALETHS